MFKLPLILWFFFLFSLPFLAQKTAVPYGIGCSYEVQKFDPFLSLRAQFGTMRPIAVNLGFSPLKASQLIFNPTIGLDFARMWNWRKIQMGPIVQLSSNSYVFGTRFWYLHAGTGYRITVGQKIQFMHQVCFGPTWESFKNQTERFDQFTGNYSIKIGLQYVFY